MRITIGDILRAFGIISKEQLARALEVQKRHPDMRLGEILVDIKACSKGEVAAYLQKQDKIATSAYDSRDAATLADYATRTIIERGGAEIGNITGIYDVGEFKKG